MPPPNDNLANAQLLTGSSPSASGTTVDSTNEADEISDGLDYGAGDVWYLWQAPTTGSVLVTLTAPLMDGEFDVYGALATGNTFAYINNTFLNWAPLSAGACSAVVSVTAGQWYLIQVPYYTVAGTFNISVAYQVGPVNDNLANATVISLASFPITGDNTLASTEAAENPAQYNSVWYSFSPTQDGVLSMGVDNGFEISVNTGDSYLNLNTLQAGNTVAVPVFAGQTYLIAVYCQYADSGGPFTLTGSFEVLYPPVNDDFSNAIPLSVDIFTQAVDNTMATIEVNEDPTNYFSVWYKYTPSASGSLTLTQESGIDLTFKIYTGTALQLLTLQDEGNDSLVMPVALGVTYYIAVCSQSSSSFGPYTFSGQRVNEFPIIFIGPQTADTLVLDGNGPQSIVVDEDETIWILNQDEQTIYFSTDGGNTFTLDHTITLAGPPYPVISTGNNMAMFFDENGQLVVAFFTTDGVSNYYFNCYVRNLAGSWTAYTSAAIPVIATNYSLCSSICQGDDGTIHGAITGANQRVGAILSNIAYVNFKDGVMSTPTPITQYNTAEGVGFLSISLVNHLTNILIFWRLENDLSNNANGPFQYCQINPSAPLIMDAVEAAKAWATAKTYYVGDLVLESSTIYICLIQHTSGVFATDLGNGDWQVLSSYATPTVVSALVNTDAYNVRSNGNLYFMIGSGFQPTIGATSLYKNFVSLPINPALITEYGSGWITLASYEIDMNDNLMIYGGFNYLFESPPGINAFLGGVWQPVHVGTFGSGQDNWTWSGGHTYNYQQIG
jgi:hypothetical protein